MHFNKIIVLIWFMLISLSFVACIQTTHNNKVKYNPAFLFDYNDACFKEIEGSIKEMLNSKNIHISKDVFQDSAFLVLSNFRPNEHLHRDSVFWEINTKKFLLHKKASDCILSMINDNLGILKSTKLRSCNCYVQSFDD